MKSLYFRLSIGLVILGFGFLGLDYLMVKFLAKHWPPDFRMRQEENSVAFKNEGELQSYRRSRRSMIAIERRVMRKAGLALIAIGLVSSLCVLQFRPRVNESAVQTVGNALRDLDIRIISRSPWGRVNTGILARSQPTPSFCLS